MVSELRVWGYDTDALFVTEHSTDTYFQHFDKLWISVLTTVHFEGKPSLIES